EARARGLPDPVLPLGAQEVARIFRRRAVAAGLDHAFTISGHSARVGSANDLINNGYTTAQIQDAGNWKSAEMVQIYTRRSQAGANSMADMRRSQKAKAPTPDK
ncbi:tyrosine-type recombinase/integrase, partial [Rhodanobacter sp. 115]